MAQPAPPADRSFQHILAAIASITPSLGNAEARIVIELAHRFGALPGCSGEISTRELAEAIRVELKNVRVALQGLLRRGILSSTPATAMTPAAYRLDFLDVFEMPQGRVATTPPPAQEELFQPGGGVATTPPPCENGEKTARGVGLLQPQGGVILTPPPGEKSEQTVEGVGLLQPQGGVVATPPPTGNQIGNAHAGARRSDRLNPIDRALNAKSKHTPSADLAHARKWMHGYQRKYGRSEHPNEPYEPHPPDDDVCAQLCAVLSPIEIENFIMELRGDNPPPQPGYKYSWYVTVALQRRHGVAPSVFKEARSRMRIERYHGKNLKGEQQPLEMAGPAVEKVDRGFVRDLVGELKKRVGKVR